MGAALLYLLLAWPEGKEATFTTVSPARMRALLAAGDVAAAAGSLRDADVLTRRAAAWVLARAARDQPAVVEGSLLDAVLDRDAVVREWATRGLCTMPRTRAVHQHLSFGLKDADATVRRRATACLESASSPVR
jgi:hypothetical protein